MSKVRVLESHLDAAQAVKLRLYEASLTAAAPVNPKLRLYETSLTAVAATVITLTPAITVGPGEPVTLTADLLTGGSPTWVWRKISGPTIGLTTAAGVASFVAPSLWNADHTQPSGGVPGVSVLVLGVKATVGGVESAEVRCEVSILPQLSWSRAASSWVGARVAPA